MLTLTSSFVRTSFLALTGQLLVGNSLRSLTSTLDGHADDEACYKVIET